MDPAQVISRIAFPLLLAAGSACRVGPDHAAPRPSVAERFEASSSDAQGAPVDAWWGTFQDPGLVACIEGALGHNRDLRSSLARLRAARALRGVQAAREWPTVSAGAATTWDRLSENDPRFGPAIEQGLFPRDVHAWDLGIDVAWELDLFGGLARGIEGATAELQEHEFEHGALMLSVAAEVARDYFELRGSQVRLSTLRQQIETERARSEWLEQRRRGGLLPDSEVLASRSALQALRAQEPALEGEVRSAEFRLAVLMGRRPEDGVPELARSAGLPTPRGRVPVGLPSDLLRRRPDVLAAERRLAAAAADIGVAEAEFFPKFYLTGSPSLRAEDFGELFRASSSAWKFGPGVSWSLFSGGRNRAQVEAARAYHAQACSDYEAAVDRALEEVESSLVRFGKGLETLELLGQAWELRSERSRIEALRFEAGIARRVDVLDAHSLALESERRRVDQEIDVLVQLVGLYKALGGGWAEAGAIARAASEARERENPRAENDRQGAGS